MNARRYPRTLEQAFCPYHRSSVCPIEEPPTPMHPDDRLVVAISLIAAVALAVIFIVEGILS